MRCAYFSHSGLRSLLSYANTSHLPEKTKKSLNLLLQPEDVSEAERLLTRRLDAACETHIKANGDSFPGGDNSQIRNVKQHFCDVAHLKDS